jgi:thiamine biosynthesis lipoprotein
MNNLRRCQPLIGTYVEIELTADLSDGQLIECSQRAFAAIEQVDGMMSFHRPDSELSKLNQFAARQQCPISPDMHKVLSQALSLSEQSSGLFDISIAPSLVRRGALPAIATSNADKANWQAIDLRADSIYFEQPLLLDLGGIAKGYAVDCAIEALPAGVHACINAGGDLRMTDWQDQQVSVRLPSQSHRLLSLPMMAPAIATSANYFTALNSSGSSSSGLSPSAPETLASAIILPSSGQPIVEDFSVSVFAANCMLADALTKWAFLDTGAGDKIRDLGALAILVTASGEAQPL